MPVSNPILPNAIAVFAKAPLPGRVKTRLHACMTPEQAAELHTAFVVDFWDHLRGLQDVSRYLYCDRSWASFECLAGPENYRLQRGDGLGERMYRCIEELSARGHRRIVLLGSDSPTLPLEYIDQAFQCLDQAGAVLGPADDGGFYALGCRRPHPGMFSGVTWSSADTRLQTEQALGRIGLSVALLPAWYDVDTRDELARLAKEPVLPPQTKAWFERHSGVLA